MGKAPSQPRRIVTRLLVFLLLGAVVNVAIAWGFALPADVDLLQNKIPISFYWDFPNHIWDGESRTTYGLIHVQSTWRQWEVDANHLVGDDPSGVLPEWSQIPRTPLEFEGRYDEYECWSIVGSGWPAISLWYEHGYDRPSTICLPPFWDRIHGGIPIRSVGEPLFPRAVPLRPIWTGFAVNTIFYAAVLWMMFLVPGVLRRKRRRRHGLCIHCGYDLRGAPADSAKCPECGKASDLRR